MIKEGYTNMGQRNWNFSLDDSPCHVCLKHRWGVLYELWVNEHKIYKYRSMFGDEFHYRFKIGDHTVEVGGLEIGYAVQTFLRVDGEVVFYSGDRNPRITNEMQAFIDLEEDWKQTGQTLSLEYSFKQSKPRWSVHRLLGRYAGYLLMIQSENAAVNGAFCPAFKIIIRHGRISAQQIGQIASDPEISMLIQRSDLGRDSLKVGADSTALTVPMGGRIYLSSHKMLIDRYLELISRYLLPLKETCEGKECKSRFNEPLEPVVVNKIPTLLCRECSAKIPGAKTLQL